MFTILGRFFIILFGDNGATAANAVNFMSAMASAATILFSFLEHHALRPQNVCERRRTIEQLNNFLPYHGSRRSWCPGYTFSDSFWFSAVEGEVYALSSFFTALCLLGHVEMGTCR